jgi:hypothetical protein
MGLLERSVSAAGAVYHQDEQHQEALQYARKGRVQFQHDGELICLCSTAKITPRRPPIRHGN